MHDNNILDEAINNLVTLLAQGITKRRMYFDNHPKVKSCAQDTVRYLQQHLEGTQEESFFLGVAEGKLVHDSKFLIGPTIVGKRLVELAGQLHCGGFLFRRDITAEDMLALYALSAELRDPPATLQDARELLKQHNIESIDLSPPYEDVGWFGQFAYKGQESVATQLEGDDAVVDLLPVYQSLFDSVQENHGNAEMDRSVDLGNTQSVAENLLKAASDGFTDIMQMVRYPDYDSYTVGHSVRVALLAVMVGRHMNLETHQLSDLATAGLLHDVGKAKIPSEVLFKKGRLDDQERKIMETHPEAGVNILLESEHCHPLSLAVTFGHHRRWDGGGYPRLSFGPNGSLATQLIHVCDVFEAITAVRPYKKAMTPRKAYEIMLSDRGAYEPTTLATFVEAVGLYPPGSRVSLSNGQRATVINATAKFDRPLVQVTHDTDGTRLAEDQQPSIDLATTDEDVAVSTLLLEA